MRYGVDMATELQIMDYTEQMIVRHSEITSGPFYFFGNGISEPCNIAPYRGVVTTSAVAEPESLGLFTLGCLSLLLMAMRRRSWNLH
jgi:hypothetical protein